MNPGLLILSGDDRFVRNLRSELAAPFEIVVGVSLAEARQRLEKAPVQAVLAHLHRTTLNGHSAEQFVNQLRGVAPSVPIFGILEPDCCEDFKERARSAMRECFTTPVDFRQLNRTLHESTAIEVPPSLVGLPHRVLRGISRSLVTFTEPMFPMYDELMVAAAHHVTVLLIGETGSGKTYLARLIHELSPRRHERCLTVACGALPPDLIESELFGYVRGAFTGADQDKQGKFAAAKGGTLLLDEIDVLAPKSQAKLLRVIETGEYEPVGSNETQTSEARLIVASNIDLERLVEGGRFRMDLYYRLNTLSFHLLPLRQRPLDIEYLARRFAEDHGRTHGIELERIEPEFVAALKQYRWPGNIRELENVIRRAVLYCRDGALRPADLPSMMRPSDGKPGEGPDDGRHPLTLEERVDQIERRIIEESLQRHNNHRTHTAKELGISRVTLYNKMKKFGMLN